MTPPVLLNYRYKILQALAEGGFGKTFVAEDTQMPSRRRCVIKQLKPVSSRPEIAQLVQERFTREAAVLDTVGKQHSQIPTLYAYFVSAGQFYLVQEWIEGEPLRVSESRLWSEAQVCKLLSDLLPAIAHIHRLNVIHRDIKPDNIILRTSDQRPCLIDFGAVKEVMTTVVGPGGRPQSSVVVGTAGYMPKEQAAGRPTFSSDLYSLGMTAIALLTGQSPLVIPTDRHTGQLLWQLLAPTVSDGLASVLSRAVDTYPQNRYATAADMLSALTPAAINPQPINSPITRQPPVNPPPVNLLTPVSPSPPLAQPAQSLAFPDSGASPSTSTLSSFRAFGRRKAVMAGIALSLGAAVFVNVRPTVTAGDTPPDSPDTTLPDATSSAQDVPDNPQTAADFTNRAADLYQQGRLQAALEDVESALDLDPGTVSALELKGDILANQSRIDLPGAIAAYTQALSLDATNTDLLDKRCKAYTDSENWEQAHQDCTQLLSLTDQDASLYDRRGDIRTAQQNYQGAIEDYTQAIEINENNDNAAANQSIYYSRGIAYGEIGDPEKALADFDKFRSP